MVKSPKYLSWKKKFVSLKLILIEKNKINIFIEKSSAKTSGCGYGYVQNGYIEVEGQKKSWGWVNQLMENFMFFFIYFLKASLIG